MHSQFTNRSLPRTGYGKRSVRCSQVIGRREDYCPCGEDEGVQQRRGHREAASRSKKRACPTREEAFPSSVQDHVLDLEHKLEEAQQETANMAKQLSRVLKDLECPICLESSDVLYVRTPCGHKSGCRGCIGVLINPTDTKRQRVCPICRANSRTLQRVFL